MTTSSELSAIQKAFLNSPTVAVVGASKEYGTNVGLFQFPCCSEIKITTGSQLVQILQP